MKTTRDRVLIIAEVGQNHDGSLGQAHAFIDAIAATGARAVKFQTHIADAESTPNEPFRVSFSHQDTSRYDYWKRMEFSEDQWRGLKKHAEDRGLLFLSSPFSLAAVELLKKIDIQAWKLGSGEVNSLHILESIAQTKKPLYISTGMSSWGEIDSLTTFLTNLAVPFTLMQCTSAYPCSAENIGLNVIDEFFKRYQCPVGLSDHSGTLYPALASVPMGVSVIEVHVTLSREMFGPDVSSSLTTAELRQMVEGVHFLEKAMAHPVDKDAQAADLSSVKKLFQKSAIAKQDFPAGAILDVYAVDFKKPGLGLSEPEFRNVIGKKLLKEIKKGHFLQKEDFIN